MNHRPNPDTVILSHRERCQHLAGGRRIRQVARDEVKGRPAGGRYDEQVRRVDRMRAGARRLAVVRGDEFGGRGDSGKPGELRHGLISVHDGVEAPRGNKLRKCRLRATTCRRGSQHHTANDAYQDRDGQPRSPPAAQSGTKRQPDRSQDTPQPKTVIPSLRAPTIARQGGQHVRSDRASLPSPQPPALAKEPAI